MRGSMKVTATSASLLFVSALGKHIRNRAPVLPGSPWRWVGEWSRKGGGECRGGAHTVGVVESYRVHLLKVLTLSTTLRYCEYFYYLQVFLHFACSQKQEGNQSLLHHMNVYVIKCFYFNIQLISSFSLIQFII